MRLKFSITIILIGFVLTSYAQQTDAHEGHDHHEHHKNEIGIANSPVYFVKEKELSYSLHIHYSHTISATKFALGIGYEKIFDEHQHNSIGIVGSYRPVEGLSFNLSPGISFEGSEYSDMSFALHIETSYEWEINDFHIGPVFEFAHDAEDNHISLGIHVGYGF